MNILAERVYEELNGLIVSTLNLDSAAIVAKATKFIRFDWRQLVHYFETNGQGIKPPYCILRPGPQEDLDDFGMATVGFYLPIEIFYIQSLRNRVNTTISAGANSVNQTVANTSGMFTGQRLYFMTAQASRVIQSVNSPTSITLTSSISSTTNEVIHSDIPSDVDSRMEQLRLALRSGQTYTNFQVMQDPTTDVSDMNPANEYQEEHNHQLLAGSVYVKLLCGEIP